MADAAVLYEAPEGWGRPATHVMIIGIGDYPHLRGGSGRLLTDNEGMGQLTSPPVSARAMANWFLSGGFDHPDKPLGSVALMLSQSDSRTFALPQGGSVLVPRAISSDVRVALQDWFDRCDADPDNLALLYVCGHGLVSGTSESFLLEDFGRRPSNPFEGAIDVNVLLTGMENCAASEQVFFFDTCGVGSNLLLRNGGHAGERPISPPLLRPGVGSARQQSYHATLKGDWAYARPGMVSVFTEALIEGLSWAGAVEEAGEWRTSTTRLLEAITHLMARTMRGHAKPSQTPRMGRSCLLKLNRVPAPVTARAFVTLDDPSHWCFANLTCVGHGFRSAELGVTIAANRTGDWDVTLNPGQYTFDVTWQTGTSTRPDQCSSWIMPPYKLVTLRVRP